MSLYYNTVGKELLDYLLRLMKAEEFKDFYLVGGTALSLQLGHRISVDIDLFTDTLYGNLNLNAIRDCIKDNFAYTDNISCLDTNQMVYTLYIGDDKESVVKLDLCYDEKPIYPLMEIDGIRMLSDKDIAAMKMLAITTGQRRKDFWDLHELLGRYSLEEMMDWGLRRNQYSLNRDDIISSLKNVWNIEDYTEVVSLKDGYWEFVADDISREVEKLLDI